MKRILTILLLIWLHSILIAQVPNTTTFSLQDVTGYVVPTTNDLTDCFSDAKLGAFDLSHKLPYLATYGTNNLLMFRNYNLTNCSKSGAYSSLSSGTTSLAFSVSVSANTMVVIHIMANTGGTTVTPASGYTLLGANSTTNHSILCYQKFYTSATTETATFSFSESSTKAGTLHSRNNCNSVSYTIMGATDALATSHVISSYGAYCCGTYVASSIISSYQDVTGSGTGWSVIGSSKINTNGGWGASASTYYHSSSCSTFTLSAHTQSWTSNAYETWVQLYFH